MADRTAFLFGTKRYLSNVTPAAPGGSVNVVWTSDGENISASVPVASSGQTPWTQDIDAAGFSLTNAGWGDFASPHSPSTNFSRAGLFVSAVGRSTGVSALSSSPRIAFAWAGVANPGQIGLDGTTAGGLRTFDSAGTGYVSFGCGNLFQPADRAHSWNLEDSTGSWRYVANGYGYYLAGASDGSFKIYTAPSGAAGAIATVTMTAAISSSGLRVDPLVAFPNVTGERIRFYDNGGINYAIGLEPAAIYSQVSYGGFFRWYNGVAPNGGTSAVMELAVNYLKAAVPVLFPNLPTSASGLASGSLWRDAAAGNVVKIVP